MKLESKEAMWMVNDFDNHLRSNNLELHGITPVQNENLGQTALNVLKLLDPSLATGDIEMVRRLRSNTNKDGSFRTANPILVRLKSAEKRMMLFRNKRKLAGVNFNGMNVNAERVVLNENLSNYSKSLFYHVNSFKKNFKS